MKKSFLLLIGLLALAVSVGAAKQFSGPPDPICNPRVQICPTQPPR